MKSLIVAAIAAALTFAAPAVAQEATVQKAQYASGVYCQAQSGFAFGEWYGPNYQIACSRALQECALRTPAGYLCRVVRWNYF